MLKCLSDTQWSARAEATKALSEGYNNIRAALLHIVQDPEQRADTQQEAITAFIFRYLTWTLFSWLCFGTSFWKGSLFKVLKLS